MVTSLSEVRREDLQPWLEEIESRLVGAGFTKFDLAERAGVAYQTFSKWRIGGHLPTLDTVAKINRALDELAPRPKRR